MPSRLHKDSVAFSGLPVGQSTTGQSTSGQTAFGNSQRSSAPVSQLDVSQLVMRSIDRVRSRCAGKKIRVEVDLCDVTDSVATDFVEQCVSGLLENAIASMPAGGEMSVTMIDTPAQWELEVADTGRNPSLAKARKISQDASATAVNDEKLPRIIEFPATESLRQVIRLAQAENANVQNWPCPLGGTAWVLVVPKIRTSSETGTTQDASRRRTA